MKNRCIVTSTLWILWVTDHLGRFYTDQAFYHFPKPISEVIAINYHISRIWPLWLSPQNHSCSTATTCLLAVLQVTAGINQQHHLQTWTPKLAASELNWQKKNPNSKCIWGGKNRILYKESIRVRRSEHAAVFHFHSNYSLHEVNNGQQK